MQYILRYYEYIYECRTTCITVLPKHLSLESNSLVELSDTMLESSLYTTPIMASMQNLIILSISFFFKVVVSSCVVALILLSVRLLLVKWCKGLLIINLKETSNNESP